MSKWPVENPPIEELPPGINLRGPAPNATTFDGPLNEFIELHGTAVAANTADETRQIYEENNPDPPTKTPKPAPLPPPPPMPLPPISAGGPVTYDRPHVIVRQKPRHRPGT